VNIRRTTVLAAVCLIGASVWAHQSFATDAADATSAPKAAKSANFAHPADIDLLTLLPPPPANDSKQTKAELAELHRLQASRTPARVKQAEDDQTETVFAVISTDLGPSFNADSLPVTKAFFARVLNDEGVIVDPAKDTWARPRPPVLDPTLKPCVKLTKSGAYPSGHATVARLTAIILSDMVPEKRETIYNSAARFAESRAVCGVHYRSDLEASKIVGTLIAAQIRTDAEFQKEFSAAKAEVRQVLGLAENPAEKCPCCESF